VHRNVLAFLAAAAERGVVVEPREFPESTHTAADAAAAVGVELGAIVKSLVFSVDDEVWAAAGTPNVNFGMKPDDLVRASGGTVCDLAVR
jgi:prolyl-tRNA editing enzyme YbaK/EbsC (Cys-tRNA(Pro) deacylase)